MGTSHQAVRMTPTGGHDTHMIAFHGDVNEQAKVAHRTKNHEPTHADCSTEQSSHSNVFLHVELLNSRVAASPCRSWYVYWVS